MHAHHGVHGCCGGAEADYAHRAHHESTACCGMSRRFMTKAERREALESYRDQLKNELAGAEEQLEELSA
ncbi:MAG TPA: hypothetical protein ENH11_01230 [Candidatus Acetothermia bacterium]|nr:hypothetical protein [Candidatus Acetothermia bacterium]